MDSSSSTGTFIGHSVSARPPLQGIRFLKATSKDDKLVRESGTKCRPVKGRNFTEGQEARNFYESVISMECSAGSACASSAHQLRRHDPQTVPTTKTFVAKATSSHKQSTIRHRQSERVQMRNTNVFLRSAQEGDIKTMNLYLEDGTVDINVVDSFNWTALMCASYSGQSDAVSLLLRKGASWECCQDKSGQTASDLAKVAGHIGIVRMLEATSHQSLAAHQSQQQMKKKQDKKFWCDICKVEFHESSRREHRSCTVHLFNCQLKPQSTLYYIPESNVGFQMMMKDGWDKEQGLGPDGGGLKFPVKTVLKRDRMGLGAADKADDAAKARVTHFKPFDVKAVKRPVQPKEKKMRTTTLNKRARKKSERKERNLERDFRQSFNVDF